MSQALSFATSSTGRGASGALRAVGRFAGRLLAEWRVQRALLHLEELGPEGLKDVGIGPGSLEGAVRYGRGRRTGSLGGAPMGEPASIMPASWTEWR